MYTKWDDGDKIFLFGVLLRITGLTINDVQKIANNEIIISEEKTPIEIKNNILENSKSQITVLRRILITGITMDSLSRNFNLNSLEVNNNIDNFFFYLNSIDFKLRNNSTIRNQMIDFLFNSGIRSRDIAEILDIGYTTVRAYLRQ